MISRRAMIVAGGFKRHPVSHFFSGTCDEGLEGGMDFSVGDVPEDCEIAYTIIAPLGSNEVSYEFPKSR
jgi:hypothetical protein